ncbi:MAG: hypothetical protein EHM90_01690 [Chloroflexi bacterium]|nr:MAG: hypothetical protein EHM90_01690 [Chloroflexota bacterium]
MGGDPLRALSGAADVGPMRPAYRVRQFRAHLRARVTAEERAAAHAVLPPRAAAVFDAMPVADQRHAIDVLHRLRATGQTDPDLLAAALLHDAGKGRRIRLSHRVATVLVEAVAPSRLAGLGSPDPASWRYPFYLQSHHEALSAEAALDAGCGPRVAAFIAGTAEPRDAQLAAALRAADAAS